MTLAIATEHEEGDLRLELRIKNRTLWESVVGKHGSVAGFCRAANRPNAHSALCELIALKRSPYLLRDDILSPTSLARWVSDVTGRSLGELFPPDIYEAKFPALIVGAGRSVEMIGLLQAPRGSLLLPSPDEHLTREELAIAIEGALATLTVRERKVVTARFGLDDGVEQSCEEIGRAQGRSRERIRQIEAKALRKLRHPPRSRLLRGVR